MAECINSEVLKPALLLSHAEVEVEELELEIRLKIIPDVHRQTHTPKIIWRCVGIFCDV